MSAKVWQENVSPTKENKIIYELILRDMQSHTIKAADLVEFAKDPIIAINLMLAGLAEVHANCQLFGGVESTSFKIKWKQIDQRGRALCKILYSRDR